MTDDSRNSTDLIHNLTSELEPFEPMSAPWQRSLLLLAVAAACAIIYPSYYGWRYDLADRVGDPSFWLEIGSLILTIIFTSVVLPLAMVPGEALKRSWILLSSLPYVLWLLLLAFFGKVSYSQIGTGFWHGGCFESVLTFSFLPLLVVFFQVRKGAPTMLFVTGLLAGAYSVAIAALAQELHCGFADAWHVISQHFFPVAIMTVAGTLLGRLAFRW